MPAHFLGIDVGTSATKALLLGPSGRVAATAAAPHPCLTPRPGWSEQWPDDWWKSCAAAVGAVLRRAKRTAADVAGVGLSGQMHGSVFLDSRGRCVDNAILWNDQRTAAECEEIERRAGGRAALIAMVRNPALTGYQAPKILWLRRHRPRQFARVATVLLPKDYVRLRLTGEQVTDVSDASGTLLLDVAARDWSRPLLRRLDIDPALLPPVFESTVVTGQVSASAAGRIGLRAGTPVVAGAGDQPAAAVGTGVVRSGVLSATIGTSGVVFAHSEAPVANDSGVLQSFCHAAPGAWCVFGCMLSAGGSLQWARRVLFAEELARCRSETARDALYRRMIDEALSGAGNGRTEPRAAPLFLPYLTGERCPYPHPHARGAWIGLAAEATRADLVRAVLEGVTLGMARQVELMRSAGIPVREVRLAGGGARSAAWRRLQASAYGVRCVRMRSEEGSALGAAILAAVGTGHFADVAQACSAAVRTMDVIRPVGGEHRRLAATSARAAAFYEAIEPLLRSR